MYFTSAQLCELTGVPLGTLKRLRAHGAVLAAKPGRRGRGHADLWSPVQALALAVARGLRSGGVAAADAEKVLDYMWQQTPASLQAHFRAGRTQLMLVLTPAGTRCLPRLVQRDAILHNPVIEENRATALRLGVRPSALDVKAIWDYVRQQAQQIGVPGPRNAKTAQGAP